LGVPDPQARRNHRKNGDRPGWKGVGACTRTLWSPTGVGRSERWACFAGGSGRSPQPGDAQSRAHRAVV